MNADIIVKLYRIEAELTTAEYLASTLACEKVSDLVKLIHASRERTEKVRKALEE